MKVVVLGGGFAGMAAAIALQERRHEVLLLERRGVLGGRATSYRDAVSGEDVDNGTHLMIAGYSAALDLVRRAGAEDLLLEQDDLHIDFRDARGYSSLDCPPLGPPLHLLAGLVGLRLPWRVRLQAARFALSAARAAPPPGLTLAEYFRRTGQGETVRRLLWDPLATAILNETPERSDARLFHRVFREAFLASSRAARLVFLRRGYAELHERLARYFQGRGGVLRRRALAQAVIVCKDRAAGVRYLQRPEAKADIRAGVDGVPSDEAADAVVCAMPWYSVARLLPAELAAAPPFAALEQLAGSAIVSVEMWLDRVVVDRVMVGLRGCEAEWVFDKGRLYGRNGPPQHLAFIIGAAWRNERRTNAELVAVAESGLRQLFPGMAGAAVIRSLVLREADATFACDPASVRLRPGPVTPLAGFYLAGDWTDTGLPATIEGAVRSGLVAARCVDERA